MVAVVVTYHPQVGHTGRLVTELARQCDNVVVVDNGSSPDTVEELHRRCNGVGAELVELGENRGIARAQNVGTARARELGAGSVLFSDQDSLPEPDMVDRLLAGLERARAHGFRVAAVGPMARETRTADEVMVYAPRRWGPRRARGEGRDGLLAAAFLLASGCLVPLEVLDDVGPMNDGWFIDHVDLEWGLRARRAGYRIFAVMDAGLHHELGDSVVKLPGRRQEVHVHSPARTYYLVRNTVFLTRGDLMPWRWRLGYVVWLTKFVAFNVIVAPARLDRAAMMVRALRDGLRGTTGPLLQAQPHVTANR
ncbi:rhamnosyltransferase [Georgenia halophila]|uniref:Rhamnosyltransferase n=1 Tax=Georgenia halophila TaxID=620889 RepID=A0ABP8LS79_9MICO